MIITFLVGFLYYLVIRVPPYVRLTYVLRHGLHTRGCIRPRKLLSPNTYRELFGVPDIALYASALNHVFGL